MRLNLNDRDHVAGAFVAKRKRRDGNRAVLVRLEVEAGPKFAAQFRGGIWLLRASLR